jgi:hypothetical protein
MSLNPIADINLIYLEEVLKPQIGPKFQKSDASKTPSSDLDGDGNVDSFEKKVRQFIYDVRHLMRKNNIPVERAFQIRSSKTNYGAEVIKTAKEKLGIRGGGSSPVSEESINEYTETKNTERLYKIVIKYKNGTTYRKRTTQSEISKLRNNPNVSSVEKTEYAPGLDYDKERKGKLDPVGQEDNDMNNDGKSNTKTDKYLKNRRNVRSNVIAQKRTHGLGEAFSNWREDLCEVADEIKIKKKTEIKEDPAIKNKVVIGPTLEEQNCIILEETVLSEEYLNEAVDIATEFFYNCGLNENGVDIVIEELGEETFSEFIFELSEEYFLSEELKKSESKVKTSRAPKGTKQYATTAKRVKTQGGTTMSAKDRIGSTIRKDRIKAAVDKAKETQAPSSNNSKKPVRDAIARGIFGIAKAYKQGMERHRAATQTAGKALKVASKGATEFAKGVKSGVETTADVAKKTKKAVVGEEYIEEKAESEQQQKLFGLALSVKRGETSRDDASAEVLKIVDTMSEKKIRDFAKTKHEGIPKKKEVTEAIVDLPTNSDNKTRETQSNTVDQQQKQKQQRLTRILQAKKNLQMAQQQAIRSGVSIAD